MMPYMYMSKVGVKKVSHELHLISKFFDVSVQVCILVPLTLHTNNL